MPVQVRNLVRFTVMGVFVASVLSIASVAMAAPPPITPEIDPTSAASALTLLAGGGLMLAERLGFRRK